MTLQEKIRDLDENLDRKNSNGILFALRSLGSVNQKQVVANQSTFQDRLNVTIPKIVEAIPFVMHNSTPQISKGVLNSLSTFRKTFMPAITQNYARQLSAIIDAGQQILNEKTVQQKQQKTLQNLQTIVMQQQTKKDGDVLRSVKLNLPKNGIIQQKAEMTIQTTINPIQQLISKIPQSLGNSKKLPDSVQMLARYAQKQGYQKYGSISLAPGRAYIGVKKIQDGAGKTISVPFPKNQILSGNTPKIYQNFKYYAGRAINSWNDFVKHQANLVDYMQKVSTKDLRKQFVEEKVACMTQYTFSAQSLATLTYYYVQIPLQRFIRQNFRLYTGTQSSFETAYLTGEGVSRNPFLLNQQQGFKIYQALFKQGNPIQKQVQLLGLLQKFKSSLNQVKIQQWGTHARNRTDQAKQYFQGLGLGIENYRKIMASPFIVGIKTKKFMIPSGYVNSELLQIVDRVSTKNVGLSTYPTQWSLNWGDDKMMSHDYVWNYQI